MRPGAPYKSPYKSIPSRFHFDWIFDKLHILTGFLINCMKKVIFTEADSSD